jgi:adenosylcobinamide-GDP ribazoletransferase
MAGVRREGGRLMTATAFLTRLPVPTPDAAEGLARAVRWFPLAGALVGAIAAGVLLAGAAVLPVPLAAGLALAAGVLVTGALHEDGLADAADGLGGGRTRERALEIMRDSRIGSYGALALAFSVGHRWAALASMAAGQGALALIVVHAVSRAALAPVPLLADYAREQGLGRALDGLRAGDAAIALLVALAISLVAGAAGLVALAVALASGGAVLALLIRRLGGYTGDGLGAIQQAAEIAALLTLAAWR